MVYQTHTVPSPPYPITPKGDRLVESEAASTLKDFLKECSYWQASFEELWSNINGRWIKLTRLDLLPGSSRSDEPHWHTQFRNIGARFYPSEIKKNGGNIYEGVFLFKKGQFKLPGHPKGDNF